MKQKAEIGTIKKAAWVCVLLAAFLITCSGSVRYVEMEDASDYCRQTRSVVKIKHSFGPSEQDLEKNYKPSEDTEIRPDAHPKNAMTMDETEEFVTVPEGSFAMAKVSDDVHIIYWIHIVSDDPAVLKKVNKKMSKVAKSVNQVILNAHKEGLLQTNDWEHELNSRIASELQNKRGFEKVTKVFIHLGC